MAEKKSESLEIEQVNLTADNSESDKLLPAQTEVNLQTLQDSQVGKTVELSHDNKSVVSVEESTGWHQPDANQYPYGLPPRIFLLARRIIALLIDQIISVCILALLILPPLAVLFYLGGIAPFKVPISLVIAALVVFLVFMTVTMLFTAFSYCAKFESSHWRATPGKMLMCLRVVNYQGKPITYRGVVCRLLIQNTIVLFIAPFFACLLVAVLVAVHFDASHSLKTLSTILAIGICYVVSLVTPRQQTLFDIMTRRIVESGPWSLRGQLKRERLREAIAIIFGSKGKRDWLLILSGCGAGIALIPAILILIVGAYAISETNQAIHESGTAVLTNKHYDNAHRWFNNIDAIYSVMAVTSETQGQTATAEEEFRRASMINPNNWQVHGDYGLLLEAQGKTKDARGELARMVDLASTIGNQYIENNPLEPTNKEPGPFDFGHHGRLSYGDLYFKLGKLSVQLADYKQAIGYLGKAVECGTVNPQVYQCREDACRGLKNLTDKFDNKKTDSKESR